MPKVEVKSADNPEVERLIEHRRDEQLEDIAVIRGCLIVLVRSIAAEKKETVGLQELRAYRLSPDGRKCARIKTVYKARVGESVALLDDCTNFDDAAFGFEVISGARTSISYAVSIGPGRSAIKMRISARERISGTGRYRATRIWATSADGTRVPVTLVASSKRPRCGPLVLLAYAAYGTCMEPRLTAMRSFMMDAGFAFAYVHARGGGELGRSWHEAGRKMHKKNTFADVVAAARELIKLEYTTSRQMCIQGASAGGLTVAGALQLSPELFAAAHLHAPFVDVLATLENAMVPLTPASREEWGDPTSSDGIRSYVGSYSPIDILRLARGQQFTKAPRTLVTTALNDVRVSPHEAAVYTALLRKATGHGHGWHLLWTDLDGGGHFGSAAGQSQKDGVLPAAMVAAFFLSAIGGRGSSEA